MKNPIITLSIFLLSLISNNIYSQPGHTCEEAIPFCPSSVEAMHTLVDNYTYLIDNHDISFGCLGSVINLSWFYMKIANPGDINLHIKIICDNGSNGDVDFAAWGPFDYTTCSSTDLFTTATNVTGTQEPNNTVEAIWNFNTPHENMVDCGYSELGEENMFIPNAQTGQYYMIGVQNYGNCVGHIEYSQTAGTGSLDCSIIQELSATINKDTICKGESISINVEGGFYPYTYYWSNTTLHGEGNIAHPETTTNYTVTVVDYNNDTIIIPGTIYVYPSPKISLQDNYIQCANDTTNITPVVTGGTLPYNYNWSSGDTTASTSVSIDTTTAYTLIVSDVNNCKDTATTTVKVLTPADIFPEQICMLTVDTLTGKNKVIWERTPSQGIAKYRIYRESSVVGVYDLIGEQDYNNLTVFIDEETSTIAQSYKYKITSIDSLCGIESLSDSCVYHKIIYLQTTVGIPNGYNLQWTDYEGFPYSTFYIYGREVGVGNFTLIHQASFDINSWTDLTIVPNMEYRIIIEKETPCTPTAIAKAGTNIYTKSSSNIVNISYSSVENTTQTAFYLYPNPCTGVFTVKGKNIKKIEITNITGKRILTKTDISEFNNISLKDYNKGIYFIKVSFDDKAIIKKIVVE